MPFLDVCTDKIKLKSGDIQFLLSNYEDNQQPQIIILPQSLLTALRTSHTIWKD